jgi:hypothetical protein
MYLDMFKILNESNNSGECFRYIDEDEFVCVNDHTSCIYNDGKNLCLYYLDDNDMNPLSERPSEHLPSCRCVQCYPFEQDWNEPIPSSKYENGHAYTCMCSQCEKEWASIKRSLEKGGS